MIAQGLVMYKRVVISAIYYELNASGYSRGGTIERVWGLRICPPYQPVVPRLSAGGIQPQVEYLWQCEDTATGSQLGVNHLQALNQGPQAN